VVEFDGVWWSLVEFDGVWWECMYGGMEVWGMKTITRELVTGDDGE